MTLIVILLVLLYGWWRFRADRKHKSILTVIHGDLSADIAKIKAALGIEPDDP